MTSEKLNIYFTMREEYWIGLVGRMNADVKAIIGAEDSLDTIISVDRQNRKILLERQDGSKYVITIEDKKQDDK